jgi:hypothetical protein
MEEHKEHEERKVPRHEASPSVGVPQTKMTPTEADNELVALGNKVKEINDVEDSALAVVEGLRALLEKGIASTKAAGASDDQLLAFRQLDDALVYGGLRLATAVVANTHRLVK